MSNAMVFCRGCGKEIHESAPSCPHCGATQSINYPKSKVTAGVLALLLGGLGVHKFYVGAWGWGLVYLLFVWTYIPAILGLVEGIRYLTLSNDEFNRKVGALNGAFAWLW